jgi:sugar/nucleoside kinase (ribokinase family)
VELQVPLPSLSAGKGKVDVPVTLTIGGFACNAARAIEGHAGVGCCVVTVCAPADQARVQHALPPATRFCPMLSQDDPALLPDISVILNPASDCRILRDPGAEDDPSFRVDMIAAEAWLSELQVLGRVPIPFARALIERLRQSGKRIAWCGGDALPQELEEVCDVLCVNTAEASSLLGLAVGEASTLELACALAKRAKPSDAMRLVTGRGAQPTIVALREGDAIHTQESEPTPIRKEEIAGFLGVGDAFAANFLVTTFVQADGSLRARPDPTHGLQVAQEAASHFLTHPRARGGR